MEAFGYLAVLISIILGLGIAELLGGMARRIEQRSAFRPFAPAMIWAGILLLIHIQTWWSMFGLRHLEQWTFVRFAVVLLQPIILYLMAVLALPSLNAPEIDLRLNYFGQRKWFFGLLVLLLVGSLLRDLVVAGALPGGTNLGFHVVFFAAAIAALSTTREGIHRVIAIVTAIALVAYVGLLFAQLR